jgi:hypothetical protein
MVISIATKTKMPGKPKAARGKTTRKEKVKRTIEKIKANLPKKVGSGTGMSPGAMGGRTKPRRGLRRALEERLTPRKFKDPRTKKTLSSLLGKSPKGAGASGAGMIKEAFKLARKNKTSGRLNLSDVKKAKQMMMKRKGK